MNGLNGTWAQPVMPGRLVDMLSNASGAGKLAAAKPTTGGPEQLVGLDRNAVGCSPLGFGPLHGPAQRTASIGLNRWLLWLGSEGTPQIVVTPPLRPGGPEPSTVAVSPWSSGRSLKSTTNGKLKPKKPKRATTSDCAGGSRL